MKVKTQDLIGSALDWAVAKCENDAEHFEPYYPDPYDGYGSGPVYTPRAYSTDWSYGGPIIEREGICLLDPCSNQNRNGQWHANCGAWGADGPTTLIATMRCFVASRLGDEVDIPEELL